MQGTPQSVHKFRKGALAAAVAAAIHPAVTHAQNAGHVDFAIGNVAAIAANGSPRNLRKGMEINAGDTVVTNNNARAQIRFSDGGYISLQPDTRFKIDEYRFGGVADGKERSFFSLIKGGLRAITGSIGKGNRANYQLQTPVATIGIRGTHFRARFCEGDCMVLNRVLDDGLYVTVGEGKISLNNAAGKVDLDQGGTAFVADKNTSPTRVDIGPILPPAKVDTGTRYASGEDRNDRGLPAVLFGYTRVFSPAAGAIVIDGAASPAFNFATVDKFGLMFSFQVPGNPEIFNGSASIENAGTNGVISWGRWTGGTTTATATGAPIDLTGGRSLHYVVTDMASPNTWFTTNTFGSGTFTYNFAAGTPATSNTGSSGLGVTGGTVTLNYGVSSTWAANFNVDFASQSHTINVSPTGLTTAAFSTTTSTTGGICGGSGCTTTIKGVFAGANVESAGLTYQFQESIGLTVVSGAAVFNK